MKKILNALFLALLAVITFSACSDVPSPYDIKGEGDGPELTGDGSKELPYTVADLKVKADGKTVAWVEAYIVAGIKSSAEMSIKSADDVVFGTQPTDVKATSFLIADSGEESDYKNCSAVNLSGKSTGCSAVKAALNLVDNNTVPLPRVVKLKGTLVTNTWGLPGLKEVTAAILADGTVIGEEGEGNPSDQDNPFGLDDSNPLDEIKADFEEQPDFVQEGTYNSNLNYDYTLEGWKNIAYVSDRKWTGVVYKDNAKYIQASANKGTAATYTSWFVSPAFTVDNIKDKVISFDCAGAYFYATTTLKVYFLELQNGVMQKTEVPVTGIPTSGTNFEWVKGIQINLSDHAGKVGFIGFEYVAEGGASKSTTYQLDNIKSGKSEGGGDIEPIPGENILTTGGFEQWVSDTEPTGWKSASSATKGTMAKSVDKRNGDFSVEVEGSTSGNNRLASAEITLKVGTYTLSAYVKAATAKGAAAAAGYVPVNGGVVGSYTYGKYANDLTTSNWVLITTTFTLSEEQTVCLLVMNSKDPGQKLLVDDVTLTTSDGGIVDGGGDVEPTPDPEDNPYESDIAMPETENSTDAYYACEINGKAGLKLGKSGKGGTWTSAIIGANKTKLSFYSVGWNAKSPKLTIEIVDGGSFEGGETSKTVELVGNAGMNNNSPFTVTVDKSTDFFEFNLDGITANSKIKFSTDKERGAVFGVKIK